MKAHRRTRHRLRPVLAAAVSVVLLAGCGGLVGGAVEGERLQDRQRLLEDVREDVGDLERVQSERFADPGADG